eukprot:scaffold2879_cov128-Skeletonema_dohrnii-CCMP3373.AAC.5
MMWSVVKKQLRRYLYRYIWKERRRSCRSSHLHDKNCKSCPSVRSCFDKRKTQEKRRRDGGSPFLKQTNRREQWQRWQRWQRWQQWQRRQSTT